MDNEQPLKFNRPETTTGRSGAEIYKMLDAKDNQVVQITRKVLMKELSLCDTAMELQLDVLSILSEQPLDNLDNIDSRAEIAKRCLMVTIFNHLWAAHKLLLYGYHVESQTLLRKAYEATSLTEYLHLFPAKATSWFEGEEIKPAVIRKALPETETHKSVYHGLSESGHPNLAGSVLYSGQKEFAMYGAIPIGGVFSEEPLRVVSLQLVVLSWNAVKTMKNIYKDLVRNSPEWQHRYRQLYRDIDELLIPIKEQLSRDGEVI